MDRRTAAPLLWRWLCCPFPGCETRNRGLFTRTGMAVRAQLSQEELENTLPLLGCPEKLEHMRECQRSIIPKDAAV